MEVITCHLNADFDCLSSMIGAKKLYPSAMIVFPGSQERKVREFLEVYPVDIMKVKDINLKDVSKLIIVDTKKPERIGMFKDILSRIGTRNVLIYDHHPFAEGEIRGGAEVVENVGATATILIEYIMEKKIPLDPMEATMLCLGIYEETGSMRYPSTTDRDLMAVAYLLKRGANLNIISEFIKAELSREELDLLNELVDSSKTIVVHGIRVALCKAEREEYLGDIAHLAHRIIDMEDIDAVILMLDMEGKVVLIGRSRVPELNMADLLKGFGGGGHAFAASATVKEKPLEILEDELLEGIKSIVRPLKIASDIMTHHVITIPRDAKIKEAETMMTKYGVNVLPVVGEERYIGLLSREIVEKALFHGFHKSRVEDFTTTDAEVASSEDSIRVIEAKMIEQNQRFLPVLKEEKIIGAITRTDLLRSLYEDFLKRSRIGREDLSLRSAVGRNIRSLMEERFPRSVTEILRRAGEIAGSLGFVAFLVGGTVRDLLMGSRNLDIDIVVEGDGVTFAHELTREFGARVKTHERFSTAKITFPAREDLEKELAIDIATARTEYYERPAALPKVEMSSIKKDLYRRDFTINTLAVELNPDGYGRLIDFFGGQRDIKERIIRVLHNLSFIEDPTRAFRAVRFSERFGFRISKHTVNLMRSALKLNLFDRLSGSRLYDELLLTFDETEPVKALKRLSTYALLEVIHPNLQFSEKIEESLSAVHEIFAWYSLLFTEERPK
ncbi:MAG: CBS domain-containing protein, partial [bacterium]